MVVLGFVPKLIYEQKSSEKEQFYVSSFKKNLLYEIGGDDGKPSTVGEDQKDEPVAGRPDRRRDKQFSHGVHSRVCGNTKVA